LTTLMGDITYEEVKRESLPYLDLSKLENVELYKSTVLLKLSTLKDPEYLTKSLRRIAGKIPIPYQQTLRALCNQPNKDWGTFVSIAHWFSCLNGFFHLLEGQPSLQVNEVYLSILLDRITALKLSSFNCELKFDPSSKRSARTDAVNSEGEPVQICLTSYDHTDIVLTAILADFRNVDTGFIYDVPSNVFLKISQCRGFFEKNRVNWGKGNLRKTSDSEFVSSCATPFYRV
jgi:hypothetical protein